MTKGRAGATPAWGVNAMDQTARRERESGWAVLQTIIAVAIGVAVVAVAVPLVVAGARGSALEQNAAALRLELGAYLAQGLDPEYVAVDEGGSAGDPRNAATVFARALRGPGKRSAYYVNPFDGSDSVVCSSRLPSPGAGVPPAVWITDDQRYGYEQYRSSSRNTAALRGTLVVAFLKHNGRTSGVDVYYVDRDGRRSPTADLLAL